MNTEGNQPSRKLGVKYLDAAQMENTFPDCGALLRRIDIQRDMLTKNHSETGKKPRWMSPAMYDNVYAILGGRGTGKSSVLLTIGHYLGKASASNILFPIITPEMIADKSCSILGWIMATAEPILDKLEENIREVGQQEGTRFTGMSSEGLNHRCQTEFFKDCRFQHENRLRTLYNELYEIIQGAPETSHLAYEDAVDLRAAHSRHQYKLREKLNEFWDLLTTTWSEVIKEKPDSANDAKRPIIILMFDDIDLVPERSMELLTTTFQFLSNINIILILTAAEKVLEQVIYLKMVDRMIGSDHHSLLNHFYPIGGHPGTDDEESDVLLCTGNATPLRMMSEFYNKVIPPANRYHLRRYNTIEERKHYSYSREDQSFTAPEQDRTSQSIEVFLEAQILRLYGEENPPLYSFLHSGKNQFRYAYLAMFGDKNRNIANGCLEIMNAVKRVLEIYRPVGKADGLQSVRQQNRSMEAVMRHLLRALVLSKGKMDRYGEKVDRLLYCGNSGMVYVDYAQALALYRDEYDKALNDYHQEQQSKKEQIEVDVPGDPRRENMLRIDNRHEKNDLKDRLTAVRRRGGTLMVMLFFIENILYIFDPDRQKIHGYRELTELLNYDSIMPETSRRMHVKLFRDYQSVNEFLDESPMLLDYIDIYTCFDVFNIQSVKTYLRNEVGMPGGEWIQALGNWLGLDNEWVRTILLMLFIQHSGITLVDKNFFLNFNAGESCRILDLFSFGGHLNKAILQNQKIFLKKPNLAYDSSQKLREFKRKYNRYSSTSQPAEGTYNLLKEIDFFRDKKLSTSERFTRCIAEDEQISKLIWPYIAYRWQMEDAEPYGGKPSIPSGSNSRQRELCHSIIVFVEHIIVDIANTLKTAKWQFYMTEEQTTTLYQCLMELSDFSYALKRQKEVLLRRLKNALDDMERETVNHPDKQYSISADGFVKYLIDLDAVLFKEQKPFSDTYSFIEMETTQLFFNIIGFMNFYESDVESQLYCGIPLGAFLIMEVMMLETLQPYYLAARFETAMSRLYRSERFFLESHSSHRDMSQTEVKMLERYRELSSEPPWDRSTRNLRKLRKLMWDVRADTAEQYHQYLEDRE